MKKHSILRIVRRGKIRKGDIYKKFQGSYSDRVVNRKDFDQVIRNFVDLDFIEKTDKLYSITRKGIEENKQVSWI